MIYLILLSHNSIKHHIRYSSGYINVASLTLERAGVFSLLPLSSLTIAVGSPPMRIMASAFIRWASEYLKMIWCLLKELNNGVLSSAVSVGSYGWYLITLIPSTSVLPTSDGISLVNERGWPCLFVNGVPSSLYCRSIKNESFNLKLRLSLLKLV